MLEEKKTKSWLKSVSAFANTFGGKLIFGITNDDEVVGLEDAKGDSEKISEAIIIKRGEKRPHIESNIQTIQRELSPRA